MNHHVNRRHSLRTLVSAGALGSTWVASGAWAQATPSAPPTPSGSPAAHGRIVSVHGSLTEVVYLLGAQDQLVGTDTTSTHPEAAARTPKVGYLRQLSAEGLLALRPQAVLGTDEAGPPTVLNQLAQAGVPLRLVQVQHRFQDVLDKVQLVGAVTQRTAAAQALSAQLQTQWEATRRRVQRGAPQAAPRVLFIMAHGGAPMTAGSGTAAQAVTELVGARNALEGVRGFRPMSAESVAQARPDWVLTTHESVAASGGLARFWEQPGLAQTPAGRRQRLISLDAMALLGFGPRLPATLDDLQRQLA
ncbi:hemin ABC transporter substrate-binding protein [Aquabacterium sp.]|uniref:heme/hemin ABC transporter substrate-binding protein n=1 Tax=Aquabacterium sp. TaxID=1872578 RepID=UPI00248774A5|nr:ABC transporter substrate-binding protein [Aquabacterium sp.]MDI1349924.1 ABC transporter substrate-binding protein [Aquabacterium sp.]